MPADRGRPTHSEGSASHDRPEPSEDQDSPDEPARPELPAGQNQPAPLGGPDSGDRAALSKARAAGGQHVQPPAPPAPAPAPRAAVIGGDADTVITGDNATVVNLTVTGAAPIPEEVDPEAAVARYGQRVRDTYGRLDLEVIRPLDDQGRTPAVHLTEVFVAPKVRAGVRAVELPRELVRRLAEPEVAEPGRTRAGEDTRGLLDVLDAATLARARTDYRQRPRQSVLSLLAAPGNRCVVLLGDPGAGKSTVVRYVALTLLAGPAPDHPLGPLAGMLPVVVELRRFAEREWRDATFEEFLRHLHRTQGLSVPEAVLRDRLARGKALVVFEGLDELFDPGLRRELEGRIAEFARAHPLARVVVTSRITGYQEAVLEEAGFGHYVLQDLDRPQIETFARRWYAKVCPHDPELAEKLGDRLTGAVARSRPIRELAGNPLLLTILALIGRRHELPRSRRGAYRHAVTVLVAHWDLDAKFLGEELPQAVRDVLGADERLELLQFLARRMQEDGQGDRRQDGPGNEQEHAKENGHGIGANRIHGTDLEEVFRTFLAQYPLSGPDVSAGARGLVALLRRRNFILARYGGQVYGFVHRAFLEYLAACDIADRYRDRRDWPTPQDLLDDVVTRHAADPSWREVLLLLAGLLGDRDAAAMVDHLLDLYRSRADPAMLVLAVRCLAEFGRTGSLAAQSARAVDELTTALSLGPGDRLRELGPVLAGFPEAWEGRARYLRWFHLSGQFVPEYRFYADGGLVVSPESTAAHLACHLYGDPARLSTLARFHEGADIRAAALRVLGERRPHSEPALALLLERAVADRSDRVRHTAVQVLGEWWPHEERVRNLLPARIAAETSDYARGAALTALAEWWADGEDAGPTLRVLLEQARTTRSEYVAQVVFHQLGRRWADQPEVRAAARDALGSPVAAVRAGALRMTAEHDPPREQAPAEIRESAVADPGPPVRATAVTLLGELWPDDPLVPGLLRERAAADTAPQVREAALRALAGFRATDEDALETLLERAAADPSGGTRAFALRLLGERRPDDERVVALLLESGRADRSAGARIEALRLVAGRRADDERVRALLLDRAGPAERDRLVRAAALRLLAGQWPRGDTRARELLLDRAVTDPDGHARVVALQVLGGHRPDDPAVRDLLLEQAVRDPAARPRATALDLIGSRYRAHPGVPELFAERAVQDPAPGPREAAFRHALLGRPEAEAVASALAGPDHAHRGLALRMLVWQWPGQPRTRTALERAARREPHGPTRQLATDLLAVLASLRAGAESAGVAPEGAEPEEAQHDKAEPEGPDRPAAPDPTGHAHHSAAG
ncbi:HEAT repeat domain-containing protein [Actinacidiphila acididurans]|uniref:HEAT repeat domain-containing protein n=1 Tax=Actinacidiphila acididurans TaxID=2784346 RepID=A0ABS2U0H7_9ACTN|nr:NACHT domain-containing protein [Actinacidiphila acididurans]MBM9509099.1 HEAT repeat domain-containing protein [Actinacidiphila acididurans]